MSAEDRPTTGADEDVKAKFRAALDAKKAKSGTGGSDRSGHGKVDHAHGAETSARQQMFRRKSGG